jgi:hypothetical protein
MPFLTLDQTRVVNPLLTTVAHAFKQPQFVGGLAFPLVDVDKRKGRILRFNEDEFFLHNLRRAPGANTMRVSGGFGSDEYTLLQDAIEEELPLEHLEESSDLPFDMQQRSINKAAARIALRLEYDQLTLLNTPANYPVANRITLLGATQWSDVNSNPEAQFDVAHEAVLNGCGLMANTGIFSLRAFNALKRHPLVRDKFKYVNSSSITLEMVLAAFNLKRGGIAAARWMNPINPGGGRQEMMPNAAWIGYVPDGAAMGMMGMQPSPEADMAQPSFGYTYNLRSYPVSEEPYYERNTKTWYFPCTAERRPVLTGMGAGYLWSNVSA